MGVIHLNVGAWDALFFEDCLYNGMLVYAPKTNHNRLTKATQNFFPAVRSCVLLFSPCQAYHIVSCPVASDPNIVLTSLGWLDPLGIARDYKCLKLAGSLNWGIVPNFGIFRPLPSTLCHIRTRGIGVGIIATTKKQCDLSPIHSVQIMALKRGKIFVKKVK